MSLIIHVGIPKSGTTFLQTQVFDKCSGLRCIGRPHHDEDSYRRFYHAVVQEESDQEARRGIRNFFDAHGGANPGAPVVLSDEALSFAPLFHVVARRLADVVPDATILITLRSQFTAITSFYANHGRLLRGVPAPHGGRHVAFDEWFRFAHENIDRHYQKNYLRILFYDRLFETFAAFFGQEKVNLLCYEQMVADRQAFSAALSAILGVDTADCFENAHDERMNPRHSQREVAYNSLRSRYPLAAEAVRRLPGATAVFRRLQGYLKSGEASRIELSAEQQALIEEIYGESNKRLGERLGLPLAAHGYPLAAAAPAQAGSAQR